MANKGNEKNLIPNSQRTPEQLKEMTRKGGIKSGEKRRRLKTMKEWAKVLGQLDATAEVEGEEIQGNVLGKVVATLYKKAMTGDVSAISKVADLMGENEKTINVKGENIAVAVKSLEEKKELDNLGNLDI